MTERPNITELKADVRFELLQALVLPAHVCLGLGVAAISLSSHMSFVRALELVMIVGVLFIPPFTLVSAVVVFYNLPSIRLSHDFLKIEPGGGMWRGWTLPVSDLRWKQLPDKSIAIYPFRFYQLFRTAGSKPLRLRPIIRDVAIDDWKHMLFEGGAQQILATA